MALKALDKRVAARLLASGELEEPKLERALADYDGRVALHDMLVARGYVTPRAASRAIAEVHGMQYVDLGEMVPAPEALQLMTPAQAWKHRVLPLWRETNCVTVVVSDPSNILIIDELRQRVGVPVVTLVTCTGEMSAALDRYYGAPDTGDAYPSPAPAPKAPSPIPASPVYRAPVPPSSDTAPIPHTPAFESRDFYDMSTRLDLELSDVAESDHQRHMDYQRERRRLRSSDEVPVELGQDPPTRFQEATRDALTEIESQRQTRDAYGEAPSHSDSETVLESPDPVLQQLHRLLGEAVDRRADELEMTPTEGGVRVRVRLRTSWEDLAAYAPAAHGDVIQRLKVMAGLADADDSMALEHRFLLRSRKGDYLTWLYIQPTEFGLRAVIRFVDSVPFMADPLVNVGLSREVALGVMNRLMQRGGGLLFVTAPESRLLNNIYSSLVRLLAQGRRDVLSLERPPHRRLPGVTTINCPTGDVLLASLANCSYLTPDAIAVSSVEDGVTLNRIVDVAIRGTTALACYTAPTVLVGAACLTAARLDPMNLVRGLIGHLHVSEVSRLCENCRVELQPPLDLPEWAEGIQALFHGAGPGCRFCRETGYRGSMLLADFREPDLALGDGSMRVVTNRGEELLKMALGGEIDPRAYPA